MVPSVNLSTLQADLIVFLPEGLLCGAIVVLLLVRMCGARVHLGGLALAALFAALVATVLSWINLDLLTKAGILELSNIQEVPGFSGMVIYDTFLLYARCVILAGAALTLILCLITGIPDAEDSGDFCVLLLGATLGMLLMASANHLLMVFLAVEMASLPSYALAGFLKGKRNGSEAALKYVVYGGGASGVMLYGISLIVGKFGTGYLPDVAAGYAAVFNEYAKTGGIDAVLIMGTLFLLIGLAFKLSAVPFHFWCPDVFEGAAAEVAAFLSVASKAGAFVLTGRILLTFATKSSLDTDLLLKTFAPPLAVIAAITATFGNLAAYPQNNLKRLLAYSTIAHAGYMLMGLAVLNAEGARAVLFYLAIYLFMNLGAFAVVAFIRNRIGSEDLRDMRGLASRSPFVVIVLAIFLLSLLGLPPLAGFVAKFQIFAAVYHAGRDAPTDWLKQVFFALLVIGGLNTAFSAFYYMRVLKVMILDRPIETVEGTSPEPLGVPATANAYVGVLAALVLILGIIVDPLAYASDRAVTTFEKTAAPKATLKGLVSDTAAGGGKAKAKGKGGGRGKAKTPADAPQKSKDPSPPAKKDGPP
jgi:NADH-quinone oxidoreductase subunit N